MDYPYCKKVKLDELPNTTIQPIVISELYINADGKIIGEKSLSFSQGYNRCGNFCGQRGLKYCL